GALAPAHGGGVVPARRTVPEPSLERLEHRIVHFLGERGLGGLVVERQDGDRLDIRQAAAFEAVHAPRQRDREGASGACATSPNRTPPSCPPNRPSTQSAPGPPEHRCGRWPASHEPPTRRTCVPRPCPAAAIPPRSHAHPHSPGP